ncbi:MAG: ABC transporter ATP-binding protein [Bacillota bacterium]
MSTRAGFHGSVSAEVEPHRLKDLDKDVLSMVRTYLRPHRLRLWLAMVSMVVVSAVNVIAPYLVKVAIDQYIIPGNLRGLTWILAAYAVLYGAFWFASYWGSLFSTLVGQSIVSRIRQDLYEHLMSLSVDFYEKRKSGDIMSRLVNDVNSLSDLVSRGFVGAVSDSLTMVATVGFMFTLHVKLTLASLAVIPFIVVGTSVLGRLMRKASREVRQRLGDLNTGVEQNIAGMRVVQSMAGQKSTVANLDRLSKETYAANVKAVVASALFFPFMSASGTVSSALVLWAGGAMVAHGTLTPGLLIAFVSYVSKFFLPLRDLSQLYGLYQTAAASAERLHEYLKVEPAVRDSTHPVKMERTIKGDIEFHDVTFGYSPGQHVFSGFSLRIPGGQATAIVGPSGAGKSTIVKLISRLYDVEQGSVTIDGIDVRDISLEDLRSLISFVPQDVVLFPGTIAENIALGRPDACIEDIVEAARKCSLDHLVNSLKEGYDTEVGERGVRLSGGQRQLVSFARALLMNCPILILDEAISSVDASTERLIQSAMGELMKGRTTIVVAHRFSTVRNVAGIVVLKQGKLIGYGTHEALLESVPLYKELCDRQMMS